MMSQEDAHRQAYLEEARDLLTDLESSLLELEKTPDDTDLVHKIFRALHTIKGSGAMGTPIKSEYIRGMGKAGEQFIIILEIGRVFTSLELAALSQGMAETGAETAEA